MARIIVGSYGCPSNLYDGEVIKAILRENGHEITVDLDKAEMLILNMCSVKNPSVNSIKRQIRQNLDKKIILAGCILQDEIDDFKEIKEDIGLVSTYNIRYIGKAVNEVFAGKGVEMLSKKPYEKIMISNVGNDNPISIVPINTGCNNACTYCSVRIVKGPLYSYKKELILKKIKADLKAGKKEFWLTSQDIASYGQDKDTNLLDLLESILEIEDDFTLRLGMMNPTNTFSIRKGLVKVFKDPRVFRFIHIPVQSGSDDVLKLMNRDYTSDFYIKLVDYFRNNVKDITVATDVIVGFPQETEQDFKKTLALLTEIRPDVVNHSRFWKRPGTPAEKMKQVNSKVIKERSIRLKELIKKISYDNNKMWLGRDCRVIVDNMGKDRSFIARNESYKPIILKQPVKMSASYNVKITDADIFYLKAKVL